MARIHDRGARGRSQTGWLVSDHTFSFGGFQDPARMGYRALRVLNEDRVIPGAGFAEHGHQDMEIVTLVLAGALAHRDSLGQEAVLRPGEVQRLSAGSGIRHSEMNASAIEPLHFLQIWILPRQQGGEPNYQQRRIDQAAASTAFAVIASPEGGDTAVALRQDARLLYATLGPGEERSLSLASGRAGFLQLLSGIATLEGERLAAGDGLEFLAGEVASVTAVSDCDLLLFDLA